MSIVRQPSSPKLFGTRPTVILTDEIEPRVHNKYHRTAPADAVYVGRGSQWGNPYVIGKDGTREEVIELYRIHVLPHLDLAPLKGKHLVCFCAPKACHADLLLEAASR